MRPVRLELHGFTAFRDEAVIEFEGADLFALTGPTGAGKSSIIDGMCFALYGSVPRLDARTVMPVISTGKVEARIRFDFSVGERAYTAVRVVRRTATGATTKEARLEQGGVTLAGDARAMTEAVEEILGLAFEQFTKSVVLPQGDFARFLHDKPSDRQELLVKLLDLGVYARMRGEANTRRVAAEAAADATQRHLESLTDATPEALAKAAARVDVLTGLRAEIDEAQPQLDELTERRRQRSQEATQADADVAALAAIRAPAGIDRLGQAVAAADRDLAQATAAAATAEQQVAEAEASRSALDAAGDAAQFAAWRAAHEQLGELRARIVKGTPLVAQAQREAEAAEAEVTQSAAAVAAARQAVDDAQRAHAAHAVATTLVAGEPCPVCLQDVATIPDRTAPAAVAGAEVQLQRAERAHATATAALEPLRVKRVKAEQTLASLSEQVAEFEERLVAAPPLADVDEHLGRVTLADAAVAVARERERAARTAVTAAAAAAKKARDGADAGWADLGTARDTVAAFSPPAMPRDDLVAAWDGLTAWALQERERRAAAAASARRDAEAAAADLAALHGKLTARCDECQVVVAAATRLRDAVGDALAGASADRRRIEQSLEQAGAARAELQRLRERSEVAKALGSHLSSRGFEQWLLDEALGQLAQGASGILRDLSAGQYSLTLDEQRNFVVVDHRSADEQRSARTLSGGETFLASLSLALTLAEHLTQLAVGAEPRLESIFLDEGFGTLDPETMDTVAAAIEELGARGRTVGIVTHVRDLADRMPVRFEVRKGPGGSTVERLER